jgi:WD40 repeat protein
MRSRNFLFVWLTIIVMVCQFPFRADAVTDKTFKLILEIVPPTNNTHAVIVTEWSPDGKQLAVIYEDERIIRILDAANGKGMFTLAIPDALTFLGSLHLAWSPSGKYIAASFDIPKPTIKIWELSNHSGTLVTTIKRLGYASDELQWYPDDSKLIQATILEDEENWEIYVWERVTGKLLYNEEGTRIAKLSPDGKKIINWGTQNNESKLRVVDSTTFQTLIWLPDPIVRDFFLILGFVTWQKNSRTVAGFSCSSVASMNCVPWLWDTQTNRIERIFYDIHLFPQGPDPVLGFSPSGKLLAIVNSDVNLLNIESGELVPLPEEIQDGIISWHPHDDILAIGNNEGYIQIWQINTNDIF